MHEEANEGLLVGDVVGLNHEEALDDLAQVAHVESVVAAGRRGPHLSAEQVVHLHRAVHHLWSPVDRRGRSAKTNPLRVGGVPSGIISKSALKQT